MRNLPAIVRSRGVGLITAIFLLVVIAGLSVAMVTVYTTQQASSSLDVQGARAYQAARAGLEWGIFRQTRNGSCAASTSFAMDNSTSLRGFVVTVACEKVEGPVSDSGDADALDSWKVTATACSPSPAGACPGALNSADYVQRVLEASF